MIAVRLAGPGDATVLAEMRYAFRSEMAVPTEPETQFLERATRWLANRLGGGVWASDQASQNSPGLRPVAQPLSSRRAETPP